MLGVLVAGFAAASAVAVPLPTQSQMEWAKDEIGVIIHFNMATMVGSQGCGGGVPPPASKFAPSKLDTDQWVSAMENLGAKYAVYVAKHGCGFAPWPTNVSLPFLPGPNGTYGYSSREAGVKTDVVSAFVNSCRAKGVKPGFYYSLGSNHYAKDQLKLDDDQLNQLVLAQVEELWSSYGELYEIWFDGGYSPAIKDDLNKLLSKHQPNAIVFQGAGVSASPVRWVGTEGGNAPYPMWSTTNGNEAGAGSPDGSDWVPGEADTTLQKHDLWFHKEGAAIRSLAELQTVYHGTVGRNTNLLLDIAPTPDGVVDDLSFARYKEFGDWIRECYGPGQELNETGPGAGFEFELLLHNSSNPSAGVDVDRVVIQEDQSQGERIRDYSVQALTPGGWVDATSGKSVGNKRIDIFPNGAIAGAMRLRLKVSSGDGGPTPSLLRFAAYGPYQCGGSAPEPPHDCGIAAEGQLAGFYNCVYGAHQVWDFHDEGDDEVTLRLQGLSSSRGLATELCLTVAALPSAGALDGSARYTNATELRKCDGSPAQRWSYSETKQITFKLGDEVGCLDCANCQSELSTAWLYTPCFPQGSKPSNEAFDYEKDARSVMDQMFGKCLGICVPPSVPVVI